jgi:hypothetical protein
MSDDLGATGELRGPTPEELADELILDAMKRDPALFVALHYRGILDGAGLRPPGIENSEVEPVLVIMDQLHPQLDASNTWNRRPLRDVIPDPHAWPRTKRSGDESRALFAAWVNGTIPYHPEVLGWPDEKRNWPREE